MKNMPFSRSLLEKVFLHFCYRVDKPLELYLFNLLLGKNDAIPMEISNAARVLLDGLTDLEIEIFVSTILQASEEHELVETLLKMNRMHDKINHIKLLLNNMAYPEQQQQQQQCDPEESGEVVRVCSSVYEYDPEEQQVEKEDNLKQYSSVYDLDFEDEEDQKAELMRHCNVIRHEASWPRSCCEEDSDY
jgi:hypothetical protein